MKLHKVFVVAIVGAIATNAGAAQPSLLDVPLTAATRAPLAQAIAADKAKNPQAFARVSAIVSSAPELDRRKRGRYAPIGSMLRALGPTARLALLEPLVHPERFVMPAEDSARVALRAGLIEAAGATGDASAAPLWRAIVEDGAEPEEVRAAAEALGRVATDADAARLIALASEDGPRRAAVLGGLGGCRRADVAKALGALAPKLDARLATLASRALGTMGSAWAPDAKSPSMLAVRAEAARAAVALFVAQKGDARASAGDAVMSVDAAETPAIIAAARAAASPEDQRALDALAERFTKNPVR